MGRLAPLRRLIRAVMAIALLLYLGASIARAGSEVNTWGSADVAIEGYDPVAYFTEGQAIKGSSEFSQKWLGATWHFASAKHRDAFAADPIRYAPQYGGFCALSVADGDAAAVNPQAWRIVDGKLYLFAISPDDLKKDFDPVSADVISRADANWPAIKTRKEAN
jgi:YHS domain-containing protein